MAKAELTINLLNLQPVQDFVETVREAVEMLPRSKDIDVPGADYNWRAFEARQELEEALLKLRRAAGQ